MKILIELHLCLTLIIATANCKIFKQCQGIGNEVYIAGQSGCRSFIFCNGESSYESSCPNDSAFNPLDGSCDDPANVDCHDDDELLNPTPPESKIVCPSSDEIVFLPSHESCENYYMCYGGTPISLTCSNHLHFNAQKQSCDFPRFANCKLSDSASTPSEYTPPGPSTTTIFTTSEMTTKLASPTPPGSNKPTPPLPQPTPPLPESTTRETPKTIQTTTPRTSTTTPRITTTSTASQTMTTTPRITTTSRTPPQTMTTTTPRITTTSRTPPQTMTTTTPQITTTSFAPPQTTTNTYSGTPPSHLVAEEQCKQHWVGNFAYPEDCHYYYRCMNGLLSMQECPPGFGWDANKKMCTISGCSTAKK